MTAPVIPPSALKYGETDLQVGYDKQGLPIGLQLIGRPWGEATILRLAAAVEELCTKSKKQPASFYDVLKAR
ncbi:unnamed protein product [Dovyalis caffra]|uniref:Amidase domain-containing protein n=1 Tax=Dovyalis caffra TaxID=77055 RepID=A0AAV1R857_9ROSI|nr:unnamed protein product [Dovyalis caffra]